MAKLDITGLRSWAAKQFVTEQCSRVAEIKRVELFDALPSGAQPFALVYPVEAQNLAKIIEEFGGHVLGPAAMIPLNARTVQGPNAPDLGVTHDHC